MKLGHASYGYYDVRLDFIIVTKNIIILDADYGIVYVAGNKETAVNYVVDNYGADRTDVEETLDIAFNSIFDIKPEGVIK